MTLDALGESAANPAGRIPGEALILACELTNVRSALSEALTLRRRGIHFVLAVAVEDVRAARVRERSRELCATYATWDEVRLMFDDFTRELGGQRTTLVPEDAAQLIEAMRLADGVVVRSWSEHVRLVDVAGTIPRDVDVFVAEDPRVPKTVAQERTDVVVFAPAERADELAAFVTALGDLELPVTIVARDAPRIAGRVRFEPPERAAEALGRARVIVDASAGDPAAALALAALGRPRAVSSTSGAAQMLRGAWVYDLWQRRSILSAVASALGGSPPQLRAGSWGERPRERARAAFDAAAPLVSVIVTTHNRPALLGATLSTIERQTYPNLEIVVVNDAGTDVRAIVAGFPRARLLEQPENRGPAAGRNRGLADARGTLAVLFDDDDEMFPDHIATLVHALLSSGLDVAYGQMINCFAVPAGAGTYAIDGLAGHDAVLDHADIQWAGAIATTALMFRRALVDGIGGVDERIVAAEDYEFWLRLAEGREWARVSDITSMYFIRRDGSNRSANGMSRYYSAHQAIYAKHPTTRPLVRAGRLSMLEFFSQGAPPAR